jgi:hypothetical protein
MNEKEFSSEDTPISWVPGPPPWQHAIELERGRRRALLRRLGALLGTGTLAFTLTTWMLLRHERRVPALVTAPAPAVPPKGAAPKDAAPGASSAPGATSEPVRTARTQLEALNRNDVHGAYELFSPKYRSKVPFAVFQKLVTAHRRMFHTEESEIKTREQTGDRMVLDIHVNSEDDEDYVAHFTLVRVGNRWWVDDLRWAFEDDDDTVSSSV